MIEIPSYYLLGLILGLYFAQGIDIGALNHNQGFGGQQARTEEQIQAKGIPEPNELSYILKTINKGQ